MFVTEYNSSLTSSRREGNAEVRDGFAAGQMEGIHEIIEEIEGMEGMDGRDEGGGEKVEGKEGKAEGRKRKTNCIGTKSKRIFVSRKKMSSYFVKYLG